MKTHNLTRRAALLGCASVTALAGVPAVAAVKNLPASGGFNPDAELLRLGARLDAMMPELARLRDKKHRLWKVWQEHPDKQAYNIERESALRYWHRNKDKAWLREVDAKDERLQQEIGFAQASDATNAAWRVFEPVYEAMFALPATTPIGVLAKLTYARRNLIGESIFDFFMCPDTSWLDYAIADMERLVEGGAA